MDLTGDEIPSEQETAAPLQPPSVGSREENLHRPLEEDTRDSTTPLNQEIETGSCSARGEPPDILSCETVPPANQITRKPPLKKSRTTHEMAGSGCENRRPVRRRPRTIRKPQTMHEMPDQLTEACPLDIDTSPGGEIEMEASQVDTNKGDEEEVSDGTETEMAPPGSDTRDSQTPAPPEIETQGTPSGGSPSNSNSFPLISMT